MFRQGRLVKWSIPHIELHLAQHIIRLDIIGDDHFSQLSKRVACNVIALSKQLVLEFPEINEPVSIWIQRPEQNIDLRCC